MTSAKDVVAEVNQTRVSIGEELVDSVVGGMEADVRLALRRLELSKNQARIRAINADFRKLVEELNNNYSEIEEGLVRLHIESTRTELIRCYLGVHPDMDTDAGWKRIEEVVDGVLAAALSGIKPPAAVEDKKKRPTKGHVGQ